MGCISCSNVWFNYVCSFRTLFFMCLYISIYSSVFNFQPFTCICRIFKCLRQWFSTGMPQNFWDFVILLVKVMKIILLNVYFKKGTREKFKSLNIFVLQGIYWLMSYNNGLELLMWNLSLSFLTQKFTESLHIAVSYTHLDVYKRQLQYIS